MLLYLTRFISWATVCQEIMSQNSEAEHFDKQVREQFNCSEYKATLDSIERAIAIHPYYQEAWYL